MKTTNANSPGAGYENKEAENKAKSNRNPQEERLDDSLRDQGLNQEESAGIANTHNVGYGRAETHIYDTMSMEELYKEAKEKGIDGYYDMRRVDIVETLKEMRTEG